jgi:hypothetical protein
MEKFWVQILNQHILEATSWKVVGSISNEATESFSNYLILPAELWPWS